MKEPRPLTQEAFDQLLDWLDPDREEAGKKYEAIRLRLIKIFTCRGCLDPESLADKTIDRVSTKIATLADYQGDKALYFYGVAQNVFLESLRKKPAPPPPQPPIEVDKQAEERQFECLESCMDGLSEENRRLVIEYYSDTGTRKIFRRRSLADEMGVTVNALRIRAHRLRTQLKVCVFSCIEAAPAH